MSYVDGKWTIRLFTTLDVPIAIYMDCTDYHVTDHGTVVFTRASGKIEESDMFFEAIQQ